MSALSHQHTSGRPEREASREGRHATVEPGAEEAFRRAYRRGWLAATDALAQLLEGRNLAPATAAQVLRDHHGKALKKWEGDRTGLALYPPKIGRKAAPAAGEGGGHA